MKVLLFLMFLVCSFTLSAQNKDSENYNTPKEDQESLLNKGIPMIIENYKKHGGFLPFALGIDTKGGLIILASSLNEEYPNSDSLIKDYKRTYHKDRLEFRTATIFIDMRVKEPKTQKKIDAIAIIVESRFDEKGYVFYFPYELDKRNNLKILEDRWKIQIDKEIFIND